LAVEALSRFKFFLFYINQK